MRILLTGADGFTGTHFSAAASSAGHEVIPLRVDLRDREAVEKQVQTVEVDAVVHLAAISFVGHADESAFYTVNVLGTAHLLSALSRLSHRPSSVLVASSANVYGNCEASPIAETQPPAPVNHYACSKLAMEHMACTYTDRLPVVISRPFNYTGPGQTQQFLIPKMVDHFSRRAHEIELGNLWVEREFNDIDLICSAYLGLLEHGVPGEVYNVCTGQPYRLQQVLDCLQAICGYNIAVRTNPALVRKSEVVRLCGDPAKLKRLFDSAGHPVPDVRLEQTLQKMLNSSVKGAVA